MLRRWWCPERGFLMVTRCSMEMVLLVLGLGDPMARFATGERKFFNLDPLRPKLCEFTASQTSRRCLCPEHGVMQLLSGSQKPSAQAWHGAAQKIWQLLSISRLKACWEHSECTSSHIISQERAPAQVTLCSSGLSCSPVQHWALTVERAPSFCSCQQSLDDFSTCSWLTPCNRKFGLAPFPVASSLLLQRKGILGDFVCPLKLCMAAAHRRQCPRVQGTNVLRKWGVCGVGFWQLFYCTCIVLGFFAGNLFPELFSVFPHVQSFPSSQCDLD